MLARAKATHDIVFIGDLTVPDGVLRGLCCESELATAQGYVTQLIDCSPTPPAGNPPSPDAVWARLAVLREAAVPGRAWCDLPRIKADRCLFVMGASGPGASGPGASGPGASGPGDSGPGLMDKIAGALDCAQSWGAEAQFAGADAATHLALAAQLRDGSLLGQAFSPVVWPQPRAAVLPALPHTRPIIGRQAAPHRALWPQDLAALLKAFPLGGGGQFALHGLPGHWQNELGGREPAAWRLYPFGWIHPGRFLRGLHGFVDWSLGAEALEAITAGRPLYLLAPDAAQGEASVSGCMAVSSGMEAVRRLSWHVRREGAWEKLSAAAKKLAAECNNHDRYRGQLTALLSPPRRFFPGAKLKSARQVVESASPERHRGLSDSSEGPVLMIATNGVGLGHLTQLLAIARRLPTDRKAVFVTMSQAAGLVRREGFPVHHIPDYRYVEANTWTWSRWLEQELAQVIALYQPSAIVFDGVWCYTGIIKAVAGQSDLPALWVRIPMWKKALWDDSVERARFFDAVIDTGEAAQAFNKGPVIPYPERLHQVSPLRLLDEAALLSRDQARQALNLDPSRPAVLLQLGAGNNQSLTPLIESILAALSAIDAVQVVNAEWLIAERLLKDWDEVTRLRDFPNARFLKAFDLVLTACGYNTFHEVLAAKVPAIFIPNENIPTDDQLGRALWAQDQGLGHALRTQDMDRLPEVLAAALAPSPQRSARLARAGKEFEINGADQAVAIIMTLAQGRPA